MCRVLEVSTSGYYAWRKRERSQRAREDAMLTAAIKRIHEESSGTYGAPRIHAKLRREGYRIGRKRVARLMRAAGLRGVSRRSFVTTTSRDQAARPAPDLVERDFSATAPNQLWVADITYVPTATRFMYLSVVIDAFGRRVVGWSMAGHLRAELVVDALEMAVRQRRPQNVVHHSDQGSQYTSIAFGQRCKRAGVRLPWVQSATASTMHFVKVFSLHSSVNSSIDTDLQPRRSPARHLRVYRRMVQPSPPAFRS